MKTFKLLALILCCAASVAAQGTLQHANVRSNPGPVVPGALVTVCTSPVTTGNSAPCSPKASIFTDPALTIPANNPITADGSGNYSFYAAAGTYVLSVNGRGLPGNVFTEILPCVPNSPTLSCGTAGGGGAPAGTNGTVQTTNGLGLFTAGNTNDNVTIPGSFLVNEDFDTKGPRPNCDVMAYGAKGDGTTDDTAAFQLAINACTASNSGSVYLPTPPSYYRLKQVQSGVSATQAIFTIGGSNPLHIFGQNSLVNRPQFSKAPNVAIFVDPGASPNAGPIFSITAPGVTLENIAMTGYNEAVYVGGGGGTARLINVYTAIAGVGTGTTTQPNSAEVWGGGIWGYHEGGGASSNSFTIPAILILNDNAAQPPGILHFSNLTNVGCVEARSIVTQSGTAGDWQFDNVSTEDCSNPFLSIDDDGTHHWSLISDVMINLPGISDGTYPAFVKINSGPSTIVNGLEVHSPDVALANTPVVQVCSGGGVLNGGSTFGQGWGTNGTIIDCSGNVTGNVVAQNGLGWDIFSNAPSGSERTDLQQPGDSAAIRLFGPGQTPGNSYAPVTMDYITGYGVGSATYGPDSSFRSGGFGKSSIAFQQAYAPTNVTATQASSGSIANGTYVFFIQTSFSGTACTSSTISAPSQPAVVTTTGSNGTINLNWTLPITGMGTPNGYCIMEGTSTAWNSDGSYHIQYVAGGSTTSVSLTTLPSACCGGGEPSGNLTAGVTFTPTSDFSSIDGFTSLGNASNRWAGLWLTPSGLGSSECLHRLTSGQIVGTGSDCPAGGAGTVTNTKGAFSLGQPITSNGGVDVFSSPSQLDASALSGATGDAQIAACQTAIITAAGEECDLRSIPTQTFANNSGTSGTLNCGDSSSDAVFWRLPSDATWTTPFTTSGGGYSLIVHAGCSIDGEAAPFKMKILPTNTGSFQAGGLLITPDTNSGYYNVGKFWIRNPPNTLTSGVNCNIQAGFDLSVIHDVECWDAKPGDTAVWQISSTSNNNTPCCSMGLWNVGGDSQQTGPTVFDVEGSSNGEPNAINVFGSSFGHPKSGAYNMLFHSTSGTPHINVNYFGNYEEGNSTASATVEFNRLDGCGQINVYGQEEKVESTTSTQPGWHITNTNDCGLALFGYEMVNGSGGETYPAVAVKNDNTGHSANTDSLGKIGAYVSAPAYFEKPILYSENSPQTVYTSAHTLNITEFWANVSGTTTIKANHALAGQEWVVFNTGSNTVTLEADNSPTGTMNGAASISLTPNTGAYTSCDGTNCQALGFGGAVGTGTIDGFTYYNSANGVTSVTPPTSNGNYLCGYNVTSGVAVPPTCNLVGVPINAQSGTTYSVLYSDSGKLITAGNAGAQAYAGFTLSAGFAVAIKNNGGLLTYTPASGNCNGAATCLVPTNYLAFIYTDGTNSTAAIIPTNTAGAFVALVDGATVSWNTGQANDANATLLFTAHGGSRTLNVSNLVSGGNYVLKLTQDATGGEGLTLGTGCTWKVIGGGSGAITPSTGANAVDVLAFTYDGTNCMANFGKNYN